MTGATGVLFKHLLITCLLIPSIGQAGRVPNLSGKWELVNATTSTGRGSGRADGAIKETRNSTISNTMSGAPFNCGRSCRIIHREDVLTVADAYLGTAVTAAPEVTFRLDGRLASVVDSFTPAREIPATAKWIGDKLEISATGAQTTVIQRLSLETDQLVVVNSVDIAGVAPVRYVYKLRK